MPAVWTFIVTETREVQVRANTAAGAILIADAAFKNGQNTDNGVVKDKAPEGVYGNTVTRIRQVDLYVEEKRNH